MTQKQRILAMLREAGTRGVTTNDFLDRHGVGSRFSARIMELRAEGHDIRTTPVRQGQARYRLVTDHAEVGSATLSAEGDRVTVNETITLF